MNVKEKKIQINKRVKGLPRAELEKLSQTELIDKIIQLEAYNFQLKNILKKKLDSKDKEKDDYQKIIDNLNENAEKCVSTAEMEATPAKINDNKNETNHKQPVKDKNTKRIFNFSNAHKRHVLLKFLYFGWDYQGFATQENSNETIEYHLFKALTRTCLIESRTTSNYHRCGRTDKEVSAYCQVISIDLRSKFSKELQMSDESIASEISYCDMLNRVLPKNIQCIAWMPCINDLYSARFDCVGRTYRYYFPKGDLNIAAMNDACKLLVCHGDFRNLCKMDVHNGVTTFVRNLERAGIEKCIHDNKKNDLQDSDNGDDAYDMFYLEIKANAFLWHQIRCIMAVLLLIGQGKEEPHVISELLDVETNPCKPQYTPAIGLPLNLFQCEFRSSVEGETNESIIDNNMWIYNAEDLQRLIENIQSEWTQFNIKSTMIRNVLHSLENMLEQRFHLIPVKTQTFLLQDVKKPKQYQKLMQRKRCESLENRIEHFVKKQRLIVDNESNVDSVTSASFVK